MGSDLDTDAIIYEQGLGQAVAKAFQVGPKIDAFGMVTTVAAVPALQPPTSAAKRIAGK